LFIAARRRDGEEGNEVEDDDEPNLVEEGGRII